MRIVIREYITRWRLRRGVNWLNDIEHERQKLDEEHKAAERYINTQKLELLSLSVRNRK